VDRIKKSPLQVELEYRAALLVVGSLSIAPLALANRLGRFYAGLLDLLVPRLRRTALRNLRMVFPTKSDTERSSIADGVFRSIGRLLVAFAKFPSINQSSVHQWIRYEGYENFEIALARGKGALFATAHLGNWELSAFSHALMSKPMDIVVRPLDNPKIDALVARRRAMSGNRVITKRDFARPIMRTLRANEAVGILIDQNATLDSGVFVDFFGIPACVATGFARLAAHTGAAVIPGFALWSETESRYILKFYPIVEMTGDEVADTRAIQQSLQDAIAEFPDQWLWIHRRWKTRPPGQPSLYN
jgi:Kdo2-lipid IVA lauroyltransferase/acyltransferase